MSHCPDCARLERELANARSLIDGEHALNESLIRENQGLKDELASVRAALCKLADVELDTGETTLELVHLAELDVNCEWERAERAEKELAFGAPPPPADTGEKCGGKRERHGFGVPGHDCPDCSGQSPSAKGE